MSLVAWDEVCLPRKEGGLGVKQLEYWNKAALSKLVWTICTNQRSLWVRWAREVLSRGESFWRAQCPTDCAWTWRQILKLRPLLKNAIWMQVGDDKQVSLFYDWWTGDGRFCDVMQKFEIATWGHELTVSQWWNGSDWIILDSFVRRHLVLAQLMKQHRLTQVRDFAVWKPASSGLFTVSSCYNLLHMKRPRVKWHNIVWAGSIYPRHSFILWLVLRGRLKTKALRESRDMRINQTCFLCCSTEEICEHLFLECSFAKEVWRMVLAFLNIKRVPKPWTVEWRWLRRACRSRKFEQRKLKMALAGTKWTVISKEICQ
ncbi:hypothetical protein SLE2022_160080 [Rubroshorea leprosula]